MITRVLFVFFLFSSLHAAPTLYVGVGKSEITPPIGTPLSGYGSRLGRASTGIHDPLYARSLFLSDGTQRLFLVSLDATLIDAPLRTALLKTLRKTLPIEDKELVLCATHTHSGGGGIGIYLWEWLAVMGPFQRSLFVNTVQAIAQAILTSLAHPVPALSYFGHHDLSELTRCNNSFHSPSLEVLSFHTSGNQIIATLIFMAAHPTLLRSSNLQFSADFPGAITHLLEKHLPGSTALFINGAAAGLRPQVLENLEPFKRLEHYTALLKEKIDATPQEPIDLTTHWINSKISVKLPPVHARFGSFTLPCFLGNCLWPRTTSLQLIQLGSLLFIPLPAELTHVVGDTLKHYLATETLHPILLGYANDYIGYLVSQEQYALPHYYPARTSFYGETADQWLFSQLLNLRSPNANKNQK